ncbi:hypothetical protein BH09BAC2_BH09BAC2_19390 [soil metagenome]
MIKQKISIEHTEGAVDGIYISAGETTPLVIIINGHNGFYNYGMFPYIQNKFFENGISSFSFNYSHGGVTGDNDFFDDLEKYEKNCMRLETADVVSVLQKTKEPPFKSHSSFYLFAHSLGGVPALFGSNKATLFSLKINGIILVSTVSTIRYWPPEVLQEWSVAGVYYKKNNRTQQELPQGFELLQEIMKSETDWNILNAIKNLKVPILIVHGEKDEALPVSHAEALYHAAKSSDNKNVSMMLLPDATHTFNTKHPFTASSAELENLLALSVSWISKINQAQIQKLIS